MAYMRITEADNHRVAQNRYSCSNRSTRRNGLTVLVGMCGRIAQIEKPDELAELMGISDGLESLEHFRNGYNMPPSSIVASLVSSREHNIQWVPLKWGMLPSWMKRGREVINARCETVDQKPMFKHHFASRRCVIPVTAYYEWLPGQGGKQPYCIRTASGEPLLLAGIHAGGECVILTRAARSDLAFIHDRMPVTLPRQLMPLYIHDLEAAFASFAAADALDLRYYPVTRSMGSPRLNTVECLEPLNS